MIQAKGSAANDPAVPGAFGAYPVPNHESVNLAKKFTFSAFFLYLIAMRAHI